MESIKRTQDFNDLMCDSFNKPVLIDYYADWCGPCKKIKPAIKELACNTPCVKFAKLNIENFEKITEGERVSCLPTFILYHKGKEVDRVEGASLRKVTDMVKHSR